MQHLVGRRLPDVDLEASSGSPVNPAKILGPAVHLLLSLSRDGPAMPIRRIGTTSPAPMDRPRKSLAYSKNYGDFRRLGVKLFGVSLLDTEWQRDFVKRNALTFRLLSDSERALLRPPGPAAVRDRGRGLSAAPDRRGL